MDSPLWDDDLSDPEEGKGRYLVILFRVFLWSILLGPITGTAIIEHLGQSPIMVVVGALCYLFSVYSMCMVALINRDVLDEKGQYDIEVSIRHWTGIW